MSDIKIVPLELKQTNRKKKITLKQFLEGEFRYGSPGLNWDRYFSSLADQDGDWSCYGGNALYEVYCDGGVPALIHEYSDGWMVEVLGPFFNEEEGDKIPFWTQSEDKVTEILAELKF